MQTLVNVGDDVALVSHGIDKYGDRVDGAITLADGRDLTQAMIAGGHAVAWDGKGVRPA
jgi:endonuclease YncB( thermonuclease family)